VLKRCRIDLDLTFEPRDQMLLVKYRYAAFRFSQVDHTCKAEGRLLMKVMVVDALVSLIDDALNLVGVAIQEVHFSDRRVNPCAAIHPGTPIVKISDDWRTIWQRESFRAVPHFFGVRLGLLTIINSDIQIGIGPGGPSGVRTAYDDGNYSGDLG